MGRLNLKILQSLLFLFLVFSCSKKDDTEDSTNNGNSRLPEKFSIDIPESISSSDVTKSTTSDTLSGGDVYHYMRRFVHLGEHSGAMIQRIMKTLVKHGINKAMEITYEEGEDKRIKTLKVVENKTYNGIKYAFFLTVTDKESGDTAMQLVWNNNPVEGIALFSSYGMKRVADNEKFKESIYQVKYCEKDTMGYEKYMEVSVMKWPIAGGDILGMNNLKMFVGKKGDIVDIYGSSVHPNFYLFDLERTGYCWAFAAKADSAKDAGVATVGLPPYDLDDRDSVFTKYSLKKVFKREFSYILKKKYPNISEAKISEYLDKYMKETEPPAYLSSKGWIGNGSNTPGQGGFTKELTDLSGLKPYSPKEVKEMKLSFIK